MGTTHNTTNSPTLDQVIERHMHHPLSGPESLISELTALGYVIVHPDDVPVSPYRDVGGGPPWFDAGWNACRAHIFGDDHA